MYVSYGHELNDFLFFFLNYFHESWPPSLRFRISDRDGLSDDHMARIRRDSENRGKALGPRPGALTATWTMKSIFGVQVQPDLLLPREIQCRILYTRRSSHHYTVLIVKLYFNDAITWIQDNRVLLSSADRDVELMISLLARESTGSPRFAVSSIPCMPSIILVPGRYARSVESTSGPLIHCISSAYCCWKIPGVPTAQTTSDHVFRLQPTGTWPVRPFMLVALGYNIHCWKVYSGSG